jgi:glycosyltransferase involved in cell wall biosynthesis
VADPAVGPPSAADDSPGNERPLVSVVIPTLNEAKNLPYVLPQIPQEYEVIIVDGGSEDGSTAVAAELRPSARIVQQMGHGKGNALRVGFEEARGKIIVMLDADGSSRVEEIQRFVAALREGADFAKGSRFIDGGGSADITRMRCLGNRGLSGLVNILFRTRYTDLCYGFNAFWASCLPQLGLKCDGFDVETEINIRARKARLRVVEVASFEDSRIHGVSNLHAVRDGWCVLRMILRERFSGGPQRPPLRRESRTAGLADQPSE